MQSTVYSALSGVTLLVASSFAQAAPTQYPLTIENCGTEITFEKNPGSVVSLGQTGTEIFYHLGMQDHVVGTGVWFDEVLPEFAEINAKIERLADNDPSFESILAKQPGLVTADYEWHVGPEGLIATREQFHELGVPTYILPTDCVGKDNEAGVDGTRDEQMSTAILYHTIIELAEIFGDKAVGEQLVADLKARETQAIAKAMNSDADGTSAVFWYSSVAIDSDPYVAGQTGPSGYIMKTLGIENVAQSSEEWPVVGWETIAKADPTFIVVAKMNRRRFEGDDVEKKLEFLRTDPVAKEMTAVKENRIIVMDSTALIPNIRMISGIETLTQSVEMLTRAK